MIPAPPPPIEMPANVVIVVARVPDRRGEAGGVTTTEEFRRALAQAAAQKGLRSAPKPGAGGYRKLKNKAIGELLDDSWIRGQAAEMGIGLRPRSVARVMDFIKRELFEGGAEYRRFLRQSHLTRRDLEERVEVQLFVERIQERVVAGIPSAKGRQRAFAKFVREYEERWRALTVCAPEYVTTRCSNGPVAKPFGRLGIL